MKKGIYKFYWDCGDGELTGIFIATEDEIENVMGKEIYFGEVMGKHSDIYGEMEPGDVQLMTDDPEAVEVFEKHNLATGYNPVDIYLEWLESNEEG